MSEEEPREEENTDDDEQIKNGVLEIIELVNTEEMYAGNLEDDEKADLIDGLRNLNILDTPNIEEADSKEYILDPEELTMEIYGMLEQYGLPADEILRKVGILE